MKRARESKVVSLLWLTLGHPSVGSGAENRDQGLLFTQRIGSAITPHQAQVPYKKQVALIAFCKAFPCHLLRVLQEYPPQQTLLGM